MLNTKPQGLAWSLVFRMQDLGCMGGKLMMCNPESRLETGSRLAKPFFFIRGGTLLKCKTHKKCYMSCFWLFLLSFTYLLGLNPKPSESNVKPTNKTKHMLEYLLENMGFRYRHNMESTIGANN